ncbi:hypothetical protein BBK14_15730 [Parafrankia soli]|uniref:GGDEF domain-containing protein n=1 Tax=Parafrankia soli TaxID=2599596 RepID=A0A1S1QBF2_9ACTN|nr:hypothetical protein BBK14_15730 [Parafrankia soli]
MGALLAVAQGLYTVADAIFYTNLIVFHNSTFPSLADLFYIGRYPFAIAALALLFWQRAPGRNLSAVLDTTSIAVAVSLLYWLYVITPYERAASGQLAQLVSVAFPVMDLGLLVMSLILVLAPGRRPASFVLLVASLVVTLASDILYTISALGGRYVVADVTESLWALGDVLVAAAALHPSMADLSCSPQADDRRLAPGRLAALLAAARTGPGSPSRCSSWTSTTSSRSTTGTATRAGTPPSRRSAPGWPRPAGPASCWPASAVRSLPCSAPPWGRRPSASSPNGCGATWPAT